MNVGLIVAILAVGAAAVFVYLLCCAAADIDDREGTR